MVLRIILSVLLWRQTGNFPGPQTGERLLIPDWILPSFPPSRSEPLCCQFRTCFCHRTHFLEELYWCWLLNPATIWYAMITIIRPVAGQGSSPETCCSFLKHFRILTYSYQTRFKSIKGFATTETKDLTKKICELNLKVMHWDWDSTA